MNGKPSIKENGMIAIIYKTHTDVQPETIIVDCADPRLRDSFEKFPREGLGLENGQYIRLPLFGGPAAFTRQAYFGYQYKHLKIQIDTALKHWPSSIKRIVLIAHQQCAIYKDMSLTDDDARKDLFKAARHLREAFPKMEIELYYGKFSNTEKTGMFFEKVEQPALQPT
jgi:hypothetical protein